MNLPGNEVTVDLLAILYYTQEASFGGHFNNQRDRENMRL